MKTMNFISLFVGIFILSYLPNTVLASSARASTQGNPSYTGISAARTDDYTYIFSDGKLTAGSTNSLIMLNGTFTSFFSDCMNIEHDGDSRYSSTGERVYDGVAPNSIITFENEGTSKLVDEKSAEMRMLLDAQLNKSSAEYFGSLGRYAIFGGTQTFLIDVFSNEVYYFQHTGSNTSIQKAVK